MGASFGFGTAGVLRCLLSTVVICSALLLIFSLFVADIGSEHGVLNITSSKLDIDR